MGAREFLLPPPGAGRWNTICCIQVRIAASAFIFADQRELTLLLHLCRISAQYSCLWLPCVSLPLANCC